MTEWRSVRDFEGVYEVSDDGQVKRVAPGPMTFPGKLLKPRPEQKGYLRVVLHYRGRIREVMVHRLVAEHFLPEPSNGRDQINHKDGNKAHNHVRNLEWVTGQENVAHSHRIGLRVGCMTGEKNGRAKLSEPKVLEIRASRESGAILARRFGVSTSLINAIRSGDYWKHVTPPVNEARARPTGATSCTS